MDIAKRNVKVLTREFPDVSDRRNGGGLLALRAWEVLKGAEGLELKRGLYRRVYKNNRRRSAENATLRKFCTKGVWVFGGGSGGGGIIFMVSSGFTPR